MGDTDLLLEARGAGWKPWPETQLASPLEVEQVGVAAARQTALKVTPNRATSAFLEVLACTGGGGLRQLSEMARACVPLMEDRNPGYRFARSFLAHRVQYDVRGRAPNRHMATTFIGNGWTDLLVERTPTVLTRYGTTARWAPRPPGPASAYVANEVLRRLLFGSREFVAGRVGLPWGSRLGRPMVQLLRGAVLLRRLDGSVLVVLVPGRSSDDRLGQLAEHARAVVTSLQMDCVVLLGLDHSATHVAPLQQRVRARRWSSALAAVAKLDVDPRRVGVVPVSLWWQPGEPRWEGITWFGESVVGVVSTDGEVDYRRFSRAVSGVRQSRLDGVAMLTPQRHGTGA